MSEETAVTFEKLIKSASGNKITKAAIDEDNLDAFTSRVRAAFRMKVVDPIEAANNADTKIGKLPMSRKYQSNDIQRVITWRLWLKRLYTKFVIVENGHESKLYKVPMNDDGKEITFDLDNVIEVKEGWIAKQAGPAIELVKAIWLPVVMGAQES